MEKNILGGDDPVVYLAKYVRDCVGAGFGIQTEREQPGDVVYLFTQCGLLRNMRERGIDRLPICEAHERFWQIVAETVPGTPDVRFTTTMRDGAQACRFEVRRATMHG